MIIVQTFNSLIAIWNLIQSLISNNIFPHNNKKETLSGLELRYLILLDFLMLSVAHRGCKLVKFIALYISDSISRLNNDIGIMWSMCQSLLFSQDIHSKNCDSIYFTKNSLVHHTYSRVLFCFEHHLRLHILYNLALSEWASLYHISNLHLFACLSLCLLFISSLFLSLYSLL